MKQELFKRTFLKRKDAVCVGVVEERPVSLMLHAPGLFLRLQGDANRSCSDDDRSSSNYDESEKRDSIKLSGEFTRLATQAAVRFCCRYFVPLDQ